MEDKFNSATFSVITKGGFNVLVTFRDEDIVKAKAILDLVMTIDKTFIEKGMKPQVKSFGGGFPKKEKEFTGDICPKDGGRIYHIVTKTGKDLCKCEKSTYIGGVAGGCDFQAWGKNIEDAKKKAEEWKKAHAPLDENVSTY